MLEPNSFTYTSTSMYNTCCIYKHVKLVYVHGLFSPSLRRSSVRYCTLNAAVHDTINILKLVYVHAPSLWRSSVILNAAVHVQCMTAAVRDTINILNRMNILLDG